MEWKKVCIGEVAKVISGYAFDSKEFRTEGTPVIKISNIKNGYIDLNGGSTQYVDYHFLNKLNKKYAVSKGDILVSLTGSHMTQPNSVVGRVARYNHNNISLLNQRAGKVIITNKDNCDKIFLYHLLSTNSLKREIALLAYGAANQANISPMDIEKIKIFLPERQTQQKIAAIISSYDDLIEINNRRITILEKMAEEIYHEWFIRLRFTGHEKVKIVKGVPEEWGITRIGEVIELAYGKALKEEERIEGKYPVYGSSGQVGFHNTYLVKGPGIIVGRKGNVGKIIWSNSNFYPIDTVYYVKSFLSYYYLYFLLQSMNFINNDAAVPGLNRNQAYSNKFYLPSGDLINRFDMIVKPIFDNVALLKRKNIILIESRDYLLSRLLSGKLSVEDLDIRFPKSMEEPDA